MNGNYLGKITTAEFGTHADFPNIIGMFLEFEMQGSRVSSQCIYSVNMQIDTQNTVERLARMLQVVFDVLKDAKVYCVSQLKNCPVEVTIEDNVFKEFRILTEVL